jgi:hypothetical protein
VSDTAVLLELDRAPEAPAEGVREPGESEAGVAVRLSREHRVEREMLKLLVQDADIFRGFVDRLGEEHFDRAQHRKLFSLLRHSGAEVRSLVAEIEDERLAALLAQIAVEPPQGVRSLAYAEGLSDRLQEFLLTRRIDAIRRRLEPLNPLKDATYDELFAEYVELEGERRKLRAGGRS